MRMYVGSKYAPGGYLWIFPKGDGKANIGLGISGKYSKSKSAQKYLDEFMMDNFPQVSILTTVCGGVPCPKPMINPINDGIMLVGDAAHQINPMTGGGIASGMSGGKIGGDWDILDKLILSFSSSIRLNNNELYKSDNIDNDSDGKIDEGTENWSVNSSGFNLNLGYRF